MAPLFKKKLIVIKMKTSNNIQVSVISLKEDAEKRKIFSEKFKDFHFKFIDAIDGRKISALEYFFFLNQTKGRAKKSIISPSELGCFLSHKKAIDLFIASDKNILIVFEDDISPNNNIESFKSIVFSEERIHILGGQEGLKRPLIFKPFMKNKKSIHIPKIFNSFIYRSCCYAISRKIGLKLQESYSKNVFLADDWNSIVAASGIKGITYHELFSHPLDLEKSRIEAERLLKIKSQSKN